MLIGSNCTPIFDLKDSLDSENNEKETNNEELVKEENRLENDYQLARAIDLIHGISVYQETLSEK